MNRKNFWQSMLMSLFCLCLFTGCKDEISSVAPSQEAGVELSFKGGTENTKSPFKSEEGYLFLQWLQKTAVASVLIESKESTFQAKTFGELTKPKVGTAEEELTHEGSSYFKSGHQKITLGSQEITIKWGCEFDENESRLILESPELIECKALENADGYEVILRLRQRLSSKGLAKDFIEDEEYVLKYNAILQ